MRKQTTRFPVPAFESIRQKSLEQLNILNTDREPIFDELVAIAARITAVPISAISFADRERLWFKAEKGLGESEIERSIGFCAHTILSPQPLVVQDLSSDPRFKDNPLVNSEHGLRFYAGFPVRLPGQSLNLGALCVIGKSPRNLSVIEINMLDDLARTCGVALQAEYGLPNKK